MALRRIALLAGTWAGVLVASPSPPHPGQTAWYARESAVTAPLFLPGLLPAAPAARTTLSPWLAAPCAFV